MKTAEIYLIRHGLTAGNNEGKYIGHTDLELSAEGRKEIEELCDTKIYPQTDFVFSSPLKRCLQTAKLIYPDSEPIVINEFIEYNFGEYEGLTAAKLHEKSPIFDRWLMGEKGVRPPFGESNEEFANRVCSSFCKLADGLLDSGTPSCALVTHGGVISVILANVGLPEAPVSDWYSKPGYGFAVRIDRSIWSTARKCEVTEIIPFSDEKKKDYYDGWDYYPEDDFDISEYV